ncbi:entericidin A/B family lipoprotein [Laribacter hongkongensis]|uniref:Entericidin EcnAB n=2 Tax=Laribacter hongkongensis TaxID=168471 RepID=C1DD61_LARHH|nr:entericidin A/B family lipoprotein [Laribacter hongkongensis]MBP8812929.1 entericidin A/B family lipoprotein [Laribacter sp.]ACO73696.1 hypothetical protein LHK_00703 [Laribacter hongkongensis HLHK9]ASJ23527.1 hypothetical protein LHGZ1_0696 [Laribacter hongkongensis]MBP9528121.1 entericidin A/B family lipoprotein [Laribacter sp.]MBP9608682.1 entericidin A/B family lipoprotein [Laribacter sp.]
MKTLTLTLLLAVATLTGCHTVQGIGRDIRAGGAAIERAAQ